MKKFGVFNREGALQEIYEADKQMSGPNSHVLFQNSTATGFVFVHGPVLLQDGWYVKVVE
jgi:hypothetical protein